MLLHGVSGGWSWACQHLGQHLPILSLGFLPGVPFLVRYPTADRVTTFHTCAAESPHGPWSLPSVGLVTACCFAKGGKKKKSILGCGPWASFWPRHSVARPISDRGSRDGIPHVRGRERPPSLCCGVWPIARASCRQTSQEGRDLDGNFSTAFASVSRDLQFLVQGARRRIAAPPR